MPRKSRSEAQSPDAEPRRRSSRLAALPQTSPEPKRAPRAQKTPTSAEKPERRGRPTGSTKKAASLKKETRGRKRKTTAEAVEDEEPVVKTSKADTEEVDAETAQEDEKAGGAGDAVKEGDDAAPDAKEEENGKAEVAGTKDEKMETNQDKAKSAGAQSPKTKPIPKPAVKATAQVVQNPVVKITKAQLPKRNKPAAEVKKPLAAQASPPQIIKPTPAPTVAQPADKPPQVVIQPKPIPTVTSSPPKQTVQAAPPPVAASPTKQAPEPPVPQISRTEVPPAAPTPTAIPAPKIAPVAKPQPEPKPQQQPEEKIAPSTVQNAPTSAQNVAGPTVVDLAQAPQQQQQQQQMVSSGTLIPQTEDGQGTVSGQVDDLPALRKKPPSLPPLQFLTKPEITITPASDAEHSPTPGTPGTPGGMEFDEFEQKVADEPVEDSTKEQDVPNNTAPSDSIDTLKKDAVQHDGMNNGESVTPAAAAVAV